MATAKGETLKKVSMWFLVLLIGIVTDLESLAEFGQVRFPSDKALKIYLPEWIPKDRGARAAQPSSIRRRGYNADSTSRAAQYTLKIKGTF